MLYPSIFEQKLGFDQIRQKLISYCLSPLGRQGVNRISFSSNRNEIYTWLSETSEMKSILMFEEHFPSQDFFDLIPELLRIRIQGTYIEIDPLAELRVSLKTIGSIKEFLNSRSERFPYLFKLVPVELPGFQTGEKKVSNEYLVVSYIDRILNEKSEIRDSASPELQKIRREKKEKLASVERRVMQSFKIARQQGWTPEDAEVTIRNGRLVIPMISSHKRKINGFVHDESSSGQTVFIEPAEIFETNNEIRELEYAERREIIKILTHFADFLRPFIDDLLRDYQFLGQIDLIRAKARWAVEINGVMPVISENPIAPKKDPETTDNTGLPYESGIREVTDEQLVDSGSVTSGNANGFRLFAARHPLLEHHLTSQGRKIVPLHISFDNERRILVISGPNAGGKSVCLKTVGLLQYMLQCGLLPSAGDDSEFLVYKNIFIDIGDEQSIDNDLSTYTSKLKNLKFFLENTDRNTLFLIDELGSGTDPTLGGAIAEATLEVLNRKGGTGIVTTHYSNLKLLAGREKGIVNGSMLFDLKNMKPLYQLLTGKPGSSFAFEIAKEIGFPEEVLIKARKKTGNKQLDFDRELQNLEVEKKELDKKSDTIKIADDFLSELIKKYEKLNSELDSKKNDILENARNEAQKIISESNKIIEKTIKEIRESQAEKNRTKIAREKLNVEKNRILGPEKTLSVQKEKSSDLAPEFIGSKAVPHRFQNYIDDLQSKVTNFSMTLDLRGKRVDEALSALQRYIDDAILISIPEVRILHGKGNGVLRQVTRDYLRSQKDVKMVKDARLEDGGSGITVVSFR